jgi:hypothetical protein
MGALALGGTALIGGVSAILLWKAGQAIYKGYDRWSGKPSTNPNIQPLKGASNIQIQEPEPASVISGITGSTVSGQSVQDVSVTSTQSASRVSAVNPLGDKLDIYDIFGTLHTGTLVALLNPLDPQWAYEFDNPKNPQGGFKKDTISYSNLSRLAPKAYKYINAKWWVIKPRSAAAVSTAIAGSDDIEIPVQHVPTSEDFQTLNHYTNASRVTLHSAMNQTRTQVEVGRNAVQEVDLPLYDVDVPGIPRDSTIHDIRNQSAFDPDFVIKMTLRKNAFINSASGKYADIPWTDIIGDDALSAAQRGFTLPDFALFNPQKALKFMSGAKPQTWPTYSFLAFGHGKTLSTILDIQVSLYI